MFWFGLFDLGSSRNLSLLIDTGSQDLFLNPGHVYKPGPDAEALNSTFDYSFGTVEADGSGSETVSGARSFPFNENTLTIWLF